MLLCWGHRRSNQIKSPQPTSSIEPVETNALKPTCSLQAPIKNGRKQCPALAQERDVALPRDRLRERGVQAAVGIHNAQAIRADQTHPPETKLLAQLLFKHTSFWASLAKSR